MMEVNGYTIEPNANLTSADLSRAQLNGANLTDAALVGANLIGANLINADLSGANLCSANLNGATLSGANLHGANLRNANLHGANLRNANLHGAIVPVGSIDPRIYSLYVKFNSTHLGFICGCHEFESLEEATAHWGADDYHTPSIGRSYVAQCTMLDELYKAGDLLLCKPWGNEKS